MGRWSTTCVVMLAVGTLSACNPAQRPKEAVEDIGEGNAAGCLEERSTIEKAVQAYILLNPDASVTEAGMVADGFIHAESALMDIGSGAAVVAAPGTVCA